MTPANESGLSTLLQQWVRLFKFGQDGLFKSANIYRI